MIYKPAVGGQRAGLACWPAGDNEAQNKNKTNKSVKIIEKSIKINKAKCKIQNNSIEFDKQTNNIQSKINKPSIQVQ